MAGISNSAKCFLVLGVLADLGPDLPPTLFRELLVGVEAADGEEVEAEDSSVASQTTK